MNTTGSRWRGKLPIPEHAHPLVRRLFIEMNRQQTTITEVAKRAGLRRGTISDWRYRKVPYLPHIIAAFNVIDYDLVVRAVKE